MNAFIEFLREYWFQLATGLFAIVEVILIVVKRKPKSIDDFKLALEEALEIVPELVIEVEKPGYGPLKKEAVIKAALRTMTCLLSRKLTDKEIDFVSNNVSEKIETVLSTPTKKEKINEK